jgi:crotonobetainyl-CoA:carnitine CoA-transferase CaiB-like acyl-CoA transferase
MFTFAWHALLSGFAGHGFPGSGEDHHLVGGSPRYRLYPTRDGKVVACAALEPKFWNAFTEAIGLDPQHINDAKDPHATAEAVAAVIKEKSADQWRPIFAAADCCVTIVASLEGAVRDPHFVGRGLFDREVEVGGKRFPALPVPIASAFRQQANRNHRA